MRYKNIYPYISAAFLLLFWEVSAKAMNKHYILPWPSGILKFIIEYQKPLFLIHLPYTLLIMAVSLGISLALGILLAVLMDTYKPVEEMIYPIIVTTQTIPITAIAPIFVLWFGYSIWSKVTVAVIMIFFPITINIHEGLRSVRKDYLELLLSMNASRKDIFFKLKLPSVLPYLFSALKIAVPLSLIGAAIGEWLGSDRGLGYFSKRMMTQLNGFGVFAPIIILSIFAVLLVRLVKITEKKYIYWRGEQ